MTDAPLDLLARPSAPEPPEDEIAALRRKVGLLELRYDLLAQAVLHTSLPAGLRERVRAVVGEGE